MPRVLALLLAAGLPHLSHALDPGDLTRRNGETAQQFVERNAPDSSRVVHGPIETSAWDSSSKSIVVLYASKADGGGDEQVTGHLYMKQEEVEYYRDIEFGPLESEQGPIDILAVFFANADKDKAKELLVLTRYRTVHYDGTGDQYDTYVFDNPDDLHDELKQLEELSSSLSGCDCLSQEGSASKAKYKTAATIKAALRSMGY